MFHDCYNYSIVINCHLKRQRQEFVFSTSPRSPLGPATGSLWDPNADSAGSGGCCHTQCPTWPWRPRQGHGNGGLNGGVFKQHESQRYESHIGSWPGWNHIKIETSNRKHIGPSTFNAAGWGEIYRKVNLKPGITCIFGPPKYPNAMRILYEWERIRLLELWSFGYGSIPIYSMFCRMNIQ